MSFPDPHHPWDPPASEKQRLNWRDVPLPELYPGSAEKAADMLKDKPKHWLGYFDGSLWANLESPRGFKPCDMTADQIREINLGRIKLYFALLQSVIADDISQ